MLIIETMSFTHMQRAQHFFMRKYQEYQCDKTRFLRFRVDCCLIPCRTAQRALIRHINPPDIITHPLCPSSRAGRQVPPDNPPHTAPTMTSRPEGRPDNTSSAKRPAGWRINLADSWFNVCKYPRVRLKIPGGSLTL